MTTKIAVPAFPLAVEQLVALATTYPTTTSQHAYVYIAVDQKGEPVAHDLIAHVYEQQGGDLHNFLGRREDSNLPNPTPRNKLRLQIVWDYIYTRPALFLGLDDPANTTMAQDLLVYWLYGFVQRAQDHSTTPQWKPVVRKALLRLRRMLNDKYSGFLVQTSGAHKDIRDAALKVVEEALTRV